MTLAIPNLNATPVTDWTASETDWLADRRRGIGASSAATVLGFIRWRTPWQVWAEKTGARRPDEQPSSAVDLGHSLEPWLLGQAAVLLDRPVIRTPHRMYCHITCPWRMSTPDGWVPADGRLVELKTAGLASGYGIPHGWDDGGVPLGYEIQARFQMHVMDVAAVELIALVAGLGLVRRTIHRDLDVEADLVTQVDEWWQRHVVDGVEPPFEAADKDTLNALFPTANGESVDLDRTDAPTLLARRVAAADQRKASQTEIDLIDTQLKSLLGNAEYGRIGGRTAVTWSERRGAVDWAQLAADLADRARLPFPNVDDYRKPPTRSLSVKDIL